MMARKSKHLTRGSFLTSDMARNISKVNVFRFSVVSAVLAACGNEKTPMHPISDDDTDISSDNTTIEPTLAVGVDYISTGNNKEIISASYDIVKTISKIEDINTTDDDQLTIETVEDIIKTPKISGFENVFF